MTQDTMVVTGKLTEKCWEMAAGCPVDFTGISRWGVDLSYMKHLAEAYHAGWLHNVMSRITPLTMRRREDYLAMADIFVTSADDADIMLDKFETDLEMFCTSAGIMVTEHMNMDNVSPELKAHIDLFVDVNKVFNNKFNTELRDPIEDISIEQTLNSHEQDDPFIYDFVSSRFSRDK